MANDRFESTPNGGDASPHPSEITGLDRRLAFLDLTEQDQERLRVIGERLLPTGDEFPTRFYRHLFAFAETARFLEEPELVTRLKQSQKEHLASMLQAEWSQDYIDRRFRVGEMHAQVGLSPQIFLGAYSQYLQYCTEKLSEQPDATVPQLAEWLSALFKAVYFDISLTLEAYFSRATSSLRRALDLVYAANTELRQFAQLTSHDLKTPLATVANLCDEALDEFGDDMPIEAAKLIQAARNRTFRMSSTIDELLKSTISLHETQEPDIVPLQVPLADAVESLRPTIDQRKIELRISDNLPHVQGDQVKLREAFYNLISNAVKFIDKPKGKIDIECAHRDSHCTVSIRDNGTGIPPEELTRIFVPFRRLPAHRDVPGSGLGLYFAKTIVEQHHGRIWVESELGKGSCFHVELKLAGARDDDSA